MNQPHEHDDVVKVKLVDSFNYTLSVLSTNRILFIGEVVSESLADQITAMLLYLDNQDNKSLIEMYINSPGGEVHSLFKIYDIMQMIRSPIKTVCLGRCSSAAAVMLSAGTKGERYALKNSRIMIHGVQSVFPLPGQDMASNKSYYESIIENNDSIMKILSHHTGQPLEKIRKDCLEDVWMSPTEAIKYGIIDKILQ